MSTIHLSNFSPSRYARTVSLEGNTQNLRANAEHLTAQLGQVVRGQVTGAYEARYVNSDANLNDFSVKMNNGQMATVTGLESLGKELLIHYRDEEGRPVSAEASRDLRETIRERDALIGSLEATFEAHGDFGVITHAEQTELLGLLEAVNGLQAQVMQGVDRQLGLSERLARPKEEAAAGFNKPNVTVESETEAPAEAPTFSFQRSANVEIEAAVPATPSAPPQAAAAVVQVVPPAQPVVTADATVAPSVVAQAVPAAPAQTVVVAAPAQSSAEAAEWKERAAAAEKEAAAWRERAAAASKDAGAWKEQASAAERAAAASKDPLGLAAQPAAAAAPATPVDRQVVADTAGWLLAQHDNGDRNPSQMFARLQSLSPANRSAVLEQLGSKLDIVIERMLNKQVGFLGLGNESHNQEMGQLLATLTQDLPSFPRLGAILVRALKVVEDKGGGDRDETMQAMVNGVGRSSEVLSRLPFEALDTMERSSRDVGLAWLHETPEQRATREVVTAAKLFQKH